MRTRIDFIADGIGGTLDQVGTDVLVQWNTYPAGAADPVTGAEGTPTAHREVPVALSQTSKSCSFVRMLSLSAMPISSKKFRRCVGLQKGYVCVGHGGNPFTCHRQAHGQSSPTAQ